VDQLVMTTAQIKAIASGKPQILEKVAVEVELTKLERFHSAWSASRQRLRRQMESLPSHLESVAREIASHRKAISTRDQNERGDFTGEPGYGVNLGESDAGIIQSMDAQLRGLEGKPKKSLTAQDELEHRQQQITVEMNKGFEPAARYEELKASLNLLIDRLN
jgi:hypothetical protein